MPWWFIPVVVGGGGGGGAAAGTAGGGITLGSVLFWGSAVVAGVAVGVAINIADDWLEKPAEEAEVEGILTRAGDQSKRDAQAVRNCATCVWCQVTIHAQGILVGGRGGSTLTLGPYFVNGRFVTTREGIILLSGTHALLKDKLGRRDFRAIESMGVFARTAQFINSRPPHGLPPGEHRTQTSNAASTQFRYDINVVGTIEAFKG
ncbi:hypothetical protein ACFOMH_16545 [Paracoccus mangrovi]|jgi:hypothetical protein|uniref:Uncharacterized protein n=1 Tax=Paracoccus mangrovi TaxID=1715645 RepID=A0ABV7RBV7_9RHOB